MNETQDTIDGLLAELREHAAGVLTSGYVTMSGRDFHKMLGRFDAAYKREKAAIEADALAVGGIVGASHEREKATAEKSSAVGNCAKLREALERLREWATLDLNENTYLEQKSGNYLKLIKGVLKIANAALAAPPRNGEVGTAMEQGERFSAYCRAHKHPESECLPCPLFGQTGGYCELAWAQMPYNEGGAK